MVGLNLLFDPTCHSGDLLGHLVSTLWQCMSPQLCESWESVCWWTWVIYHMQFIFQLYRHHYHPMIFIYACWNWISQVKKVGCAWPKHKCATSSLLSLHLLSPLFPSPATSSMPSLYLLPPPTYQTSISNHLLPALLPSPGTPWLLSCHSVRTRMWSLCTGLLLHPLIISLVSGITTLHCTILHCTPL